MKGNAVNPEQEKETRDVNGKNARSDEVRSEEKRPTGQAETASTDDAQGSDAAREASLEADVEALQHELEALQHQMTELNDKLLRQAAEYQNYRRRTEREKSKMMELGQRHVALHMLEVLDDFQRSLQAADQVKGNEEQEVTPEYASFREGVEFVYQKFLTQFEKLGVEPIEAVGQPFDEQLHEAVLQQPAPDGTAEGTILEEVQKGYIMGDRVLRHSKVVVAA